MGYLDKYTGGKEISKSEFESKKSKGQISKTPSSVRKTASGATYTYPKQQMKESTNEAMQEGMQEYTSQRLMNKLEKKPMNKKTAKKMGKSLGEASASAFGKAASSLVSGKALEGAGKASAPRQVIREKLTKSSKFVPYKKEEQETYKDIKKIPNFKGNPPKPNKKKYNENMMKLEMMTRKK